MTNWLYTDTELKRILSRNNDPNNEESSVANTVKELIPHLQTTPCYEYLPATIFNALEDAETFHTFNRALDRVYDFTDRHKIWLGFMPMKEGK